MAAKPIREELPEELREFSEMTTRSLHLRADTINEAKRTVEAAITTENPVMVFDWGRFEPIREILLSSGRDANDRQVVMLDTHQRMGIGDVIGSIRDIRTDNNEVIGRLYFAENNYKADQAWNLVRQGHLTDVSAGYRVEKYTDIEPGQSAVINGRTFENKYDMPLRVSTQWKLREGSLVPIGADEASKIKREILEKNQQRSATKMDEEKKQQNPPAAPAVSAPAAPAVDVEKLERETREKEVKRYSEIMAIGNNFNMVDEAQKAYRDGVSVDGFRQQVLTNLESKKAIDTKQTTLDLTESEKKRYSFSNLLIALTTQEPKDYEAARFELEVSEALEKKLNRKAQGVFIPHEVLVGRAYTEMNKRDLTAGSGAASLVGTDHLAGSFIELLRNKIVVQQLGVLTLTGLSGNVSIPRQTGSATAAWLATEATSVTATDQSFDSVTLSPKNVVADTKISRQAVLQANPSIEALVMSDLIAVLARAIDLGAINGSGASGQPTGILNVSGIGSVDGTSLDWAKVVEFETDVAAANADIGSMNWLTNASVRGICKTRKKDAGSGIFLWESGEMNGYPGNVSEQVPADTLIFGAFSQLIMAFWGVLDLMVNPYLYAATRYVAIHGTQTVDIAVRHAAAFSASENVS